MKQARLWCAAIGVIVIGSFFLFLWSPYQGDDLGYRSVLEGANPFTQWGGTYFNWLSFHWHYGNGRMADKLMPVLFLLPKWIVALICASFTGLMYFLSIKSASIKSVGWGMVVIGLIYFALPWWDSFFLFACQTNYVWTSALILAAYYFAFSRGDFPWWLGAAACLVGCMMHEGATIPFLIGVISYFLLNLRAPSLKQWLAIFCVILGTLFVLSPGARMRIENVGTGDDSLFWLLIKSVPIAILLSLYLIVCLISPKWRKVFLKLMKSPVLILAAASFAGIFICAYSGIVGRSGWFAELWAIIVFAWIFRETALKWADALAVGIFDCILLSVVLCVAWQCEARREYSNFLERYLLADDGIVYMEFTKDSRQPTLITHNRVRGIPDTDDWYLKERMSHFYRRDSILPKVLPTEAERLILDGVSDNEMVLSNGDIITKSLPEGFCRICEFPYFTANGLVAEKINDSLFYITPRILDPGDRDKYVEE